MSRLDTSKLSKKCLVCQAKHDTCYFHLDTHGTPWMYCCKCSDSMDLEDYCAINGIEMPTEEEVARVVTYIEGSKELQKMAWPRSFAPLWDSRSAAGREYLATRGIEPSDGMFYCTEREGIVFPYYYESTCVGAQIRLIEPTPGRSKMVSVTGTSVSKLFYGWNQGDLPQNVKYLVVTEGAFNAIALQQTFNHHYKSALHNPYKFVAASGSSIGKHRSEVLRELIAEGYKIILAPDSDEAGVKMLEKAIGEECVTHWTRTDDEGLDWNDVLKLRGPDALKSQLLGNLRKI
jgi:hypothetical protein